MAGQDRCKLGRIERGSLARGPHLAFRAKAGIAPSRHFATGDAKGSLNHVIGAYLCDETPSLRCWWCAIHEGIRRDLQRLAFVRKQSAAQGHSRDKYRDDRQNYYTVVPWRNDPSQLSVQKFLGVLIHFYRFLRGYPYLNARKRSAFQVAQETGHWAAGRYLRRRAAGIVSGCEPMRLIHRCSFPFNGAAQSWCRSMIHSP
jgi:hypothetical protein